MKAELKISNVRTLGSGATRMYFYVDGDWALAEANELAAQAKATVEMPDRPPVKSDGQKAYEASKPDYCATIEPWDYLPLAEKNRFHRAAAAVTGKPSVVEKEPEPRPSQGERFFLAHLNGGAYPYNWRTMPEPERKTWIARAMRYEESAK
jgi:hypothetical protein